MKPQTKKKSLQIKKKTVSPYQKISPHTKERTPYLKQNLPMLKKYSHTHKKSHPIPRKKILPILKKNLSFQEIFSQRSPGNQKSF